MENFLTRLSRQFLDLLKGTLGRIPPCLMNLSDFYWTAFLRSYCLRVPLPATQLLLFALLLGLVGKDYGVPDLVYHDDGLKQFFVGLSIGLLNSYVLLVGYLLWQAHPIPNPLAGSASPNPPCQWWVYSICVTFSLGITVFLAVTLVDVVAWMARMAGEPRPWQELAHGLPKETVIWLLFGIVVSVVLTVIAVQLLPKLRSQIPTQVVDLCKQFTNPLVPVPESGSKSTNAESPWPWYNGFLLILMICAILVYLLVLYLAALLANWIWPILVGAFLTYVIAFVSHYTFQTQYRTLFNRLKDNMGFNKNDTQHNEELKVSLTAITSLLVIISLLNLAVWLSRCSSPVVVVTFLLTCLVTAYGIIVHVFYRSAAFFWCGLVILLVLGGVIPHRYRINTPYVDKQPSPYDSVLDLSKQCIDERYTYDRKLSLVGLATSRLAHAYGAQWVAPFGEPMGALTHLLATVAVGNIKHQDVEIALVHPPKLVPWVDPTPGSLWPTDGPVELLRIDERTMYSCRRRGQATEPEPLVVIAVSGGGLRAAVWTLQALQELEIAFGKKGIDFPSRVRLICGASGGMLGAACYVASLPPQDERLRVVQALASDGNGCRCYAERREKGMKDLRESLGRSDFLTPVVEHAVYHDLPCLLSPWPNLNDRGQALETTWRRYLKKSQDRREGVGNDKGLLDLTFHELAEKEKQGECPSLVFSPMMIEDGRRLLISNLDLRYVTANAGNRLGCGSVHELANVLYSIEAVELFRLFPGWQRTLTLGTAARLSASFPYVSPAVTLPTRPRRRVVDAGYYDNYGVSVASSWLFSAHNQEWIQRNCSRIVLIQIRDSVSDPERCLLKVPPEESRFLDRAVEDFSSPNEGMYNSIFASASYRNDGQLELLSHFYRMNWLRIETRRLDRELARLLKEEINHDGKREGSDKRLGRAVAIRKEIQSGVVSLLGNDEKVPCEKLEMLLRKVLTDDKFAHPCDGPADAVKLIRRWLAAQFVEESWRGRKPHLERFFTTVTFELEGRAALSWYLPKKDWEVIAQGRKRVFGNGEAMGNGKAVSDLLRWWTNGMVID